jgi:transcription termination factor NusB
MDNLLKSKTRLAFIQIIFENLSTKKNIKEIYKNFDINYKGIVVKNFQDKGEIKFEFSSNFLKKLTNYYYDYTKDGNFLNLIDRYILFKRNFKKWDLINQSILLASLSELHSTEQNKIKIVINDYLNVGKSFIDDKEIKTINAIIDKIIYDRK